MDKLDELKKACAEAEKETLRTACLVLRQIQHQDLWKYGVEPERAAHLALVAALETRVKELEGALMKVPIVRLADGGLCWRCVGCGAGAGMTKDGQKIEESCKADCWVQAVEAALHNREEKG